MQNTPQKEMAFMDHLEELRWHIIRALIAVIIFTILAFAFMDVIFQELLLGPVKPDFWTYRMLCKVGMCITEFDFKLQNRTMAGQFSMHIVASFVAGIII